MKKLTIMLLAFLSVSGLVSAQTFKATGAVNWDIGYELDHQTSGFEVQIQDLKFDVDVGDPSVVEKTGDGMYGYIGITGLTVQTDPDTSHTAQYLSPSDSINASTDWGLKALYLSWDQLSAKLVFNDNANVVLWFNNYNAFYHSMTFTTYNGDGYGISNAYAYSIYKGLYGGDDISSSLYNSWELSGDDGTPNNKVFFKASNYAWDAPIANAFVTANYSIPAVVDLTAQVGSYMSYRDTDRYLIVDGDIINNGNYGYNGILTAKLTAVENLTAIAAVSGVFGVPLADYSPLAFGGKVQYKLSVSDDIVITPSVYFDGQLSDEVDTTDGLDYAVAAGVKADFLKSTFTLNAGYGNEDGSTVVNSFRATAALNFKTIEGLLLQAAAEYIDDNLDADADDTLGFHGFVSYDVAVGKATISPFVEASSSTLQGDDYDLYAKAGASVTGFMANTTFKLFWDSNDLMDKYNSTAGNTLGRVVIRTSISF